MAKKKKGEKPGDARFYDAIPFDLVRPAEGSEDYKDGWDQAAYSRPRLSGMPADWYKGYDDRLKFQEKYPKGFFLG